MNPLILLRFLKKSIAKSKKTNIVKLVIRKYRRLILKLSKKLIIDFGDYRRTVFLAGTGRSGTTWVQEVINYDNSFRIMFEPFHSLKIPLLKGWNYLQYLRPDSLDDKFQESAKIILNGNIRHTWIDYNNRRLIARKRLIKDIRANLFLKWIKQNFPEIPIILLLRHPCAVTNSKIIRGWDTHLSDYLMQEELMTDFLNPFKNEIESAVVTFDKHIFMWCIENYIPLKQFNKGEVFVTFYENICTNPQKEISTILSFLGEDSLPKTFDNFSSPSFQSRKDSTIMTGTNLINSWRKNVSQEQIDRVIEILQIFGLDQIYGESDLPLVSGDDALKTFST